MRQQRLKSSTLTQGLAVVLIKESHHQLPGRSWTGNAKLKNLHSVTYIQDCIIIKAPLQGLNKLIDVFSRQQWGVGKSKLPTNWKWKGLHLLSENRRGIALCIGSRMQRNPRQRQQKLINVSDLEEKWGEGSRQYKKYGNTFLCASFHSVLLLNYVKILLIQKLRKILSLTTPLPCYT